MTPEETLYEQKLQHELQVRREKMRQEAIPNWEPYYGNFCIPFPQSEIISVGGAVDFLQYYGKPLSDELWEDLIHGLQISRLQLLRYNGSDVFVGRTFGSCTITLNKNENVIGILWHPYPVPKDIRTFNVQQYQNRKINHGIPYN